ncbi:extensin [Streptomyces griseoluteus]|uniref:extensin n=1 Tax=Streptomyces griseoluteus TaxID=29306 RepID=UPI0036F67497
MADEHDKWLDGETSERLLRGEPLETVDPDARVPADRLAGLLGALAAQGAPAIGELPGEKAALAAFRDARAAVPAESAYGYGDAGLVRIGAPAPRTRTRPSRWGRPVRLGLAAALAAGTLGGVAVAAGSGVLPGPFRHDAPRPGASVSATATTARPGEPASPTPSPGTSGTPDVTPRAPAPDASDDTAASTGKATDRPSSAEPSRRPGARWWAAATACRDLREGREPDAGNRRTLEGLAGGPTRVKVYCRALLAAAEANGRTHDHRGTDGGGDKDESGGRPDDNQGDDDGRTPRPRPRLNLPSTRQIPSDLQLCNFQKFVSERCDVSGGDGAVLSEPTGHRP